MPKHKKPTVGELAEWKVKNEFGNSANAIAAEAGRSHHTVIKYLASEVFTDNPTVAEAVLKLRNKEIDDLEILGGKARANTHMILDCMVPDNLKPGTMAAAKWARASAIPNTAVLDRVTQQRRQITGHGDAQSLTAIIQAVHKDIENEYHGKANGPQVNIGQVNVQINNTGKPGGNGQGGEAADR